MAITSLAERNKKNGFMTLKESVATQEISVFHNVDAFEDVSEKDIKNAIYEKMIKEIDASSVVHITKIAMNLSSQNIYNMRINICKPDTKFKLVQNDTFILEGNHFTEEEISEALKIAYPERFI